jgi:hypothetical protein
MVSPIQRTYGLTPELQSVRSIRAISIQQDFTYELREASVSLQARGDRDVEVVDGVVCRTRGKLVLGGSVYIPPEVLTAQDLTAAEWVQYVLEEWGDPEELFEFTQQPNVDITYQVIICAPEDPHQYQVRVMAEIHS